MKKYLITGIAILMPVALTAMIILFLFNFFTAPFVSVVEHLVYFTQKHFNFILSKGLTLFISRILVILFLFIFIVLLGIIARWFLIKNIISATHRLMYRIPIINSIYKVCKEIISALFALDGKKAFHHPVLIPFPDKPTFGIGFSAGEVAKECQEKVDFPLVSVFAPTAPHPISGFLFLVSQDDVHKLDMTNEEAIKFLVSCGLVYPTTEKRVDHDPF